MMFERMRSTEYIKFNSNIYFSSLTKGFIFYFCFSSVAQYIQLTIVNGGKWSSVPLPDPVPFTVPDPVPFTVPDPVPFTVPDPVPFTVPCSGTDVKRFGRWEQIAGGRLRGRVIWGP